MFWLLILALSGTTVGSIGGAVVLGVEGTILGGSMGIVGGVLCWTVVGMIERIQSERRLDRYFRQDYLE